MFLFLNPGLYTCALTAASQFYCSVSRVTAAFFAFLTQDSDFVATVRAPSPKPALPVFYDNMRLQKVERSIHDISSLLRFSKKTLFVMSPEGTDTSERDNVH